MRVYIIFRISDYTHPVAMTLNKDAANEYVQKMNKEDGWVHHYFMESHLATNAISKFSCE